MRYQERSIPETWQTCTNSNSVWASSGLKAMYLERSWGVVSASMGGGPWGCGGTVCAEAWCRGRARLLGGSMLTSGSSFGFTLAPHRRGNRLLK